MKVILRKDWLKVALVLIVIGAAAACKKESPAIIQPTAANYDKGFTFQEDFNQVLPDWVYYNTDTVCTTVVKFIALDSPAISYTWTIGTNNYVGKEARLIFPAEYLSSNKQLPVTLSMRYKTPTAVDTSRSFFKMLTFLNPCQSKCNGIFKGFIDNTNHPDSFTINTCAGDLLHPEPGFYLENSQISCGRFFDELPDTYGIGYGQILFSGAGNWVCNAPSGIINIYNDTVMISYRSFDNGLLESPSDHVFKGIRK